MIIKIISDTKGAIENEPLMSEISYTTSDEETATSMAVIFYRLLLALGYSEESIDEAFVNVGNGDY
jgi:Holliday junction resolvasome RuvABC DNA-binding subunit